MGRIVTARQITPEGGDHIIVFCTECGAAVHEKFVDVHEAEHDELDLLKEILADLRREDAKIVTRPLVHWIDRLGGMVHALPDVTVEIQSSPSVYEVTCDICVEHIKRMLGINVV